MILRSFLFLLLAFLDGQMSQTFGSKQESYYYCEFEADLVVYMTDFIF